MSVTEAPEDSAEYYYYGICLLGKINKRSLAVFPCISQSLTSASPSSSQTGIIPTRREGERGKENARTSYFKRKSGNERGEQRAEKC